MTDAIDIEGLKRLAAELRSAAKLIRQSLKCVPGTATWTDCEQSKACDAAADTIERLQAANTALQRELDEARNALAYAIKEADGWHDDSRGGPVNGLEMDAARAIAARQQKGEL